MSDDGRCHKSAGENRAYERQRGEGKEDSEAVRHVLSYFLTGVSGAGAALLPPTPCLGACASLVVLSLGGLGKNKTKQNKAVFGIRLLLGWGTTLPDTNSKAVAKAPRLGVKWALWRQ